MDAALAVAILAVVSAWAVLFFAIRRWGPGYAKRGVRCPVQRVRAKVKVEQREGDFGSLRVADVCACSLFPDAPLTCGKECLAQL